MIQTATRCGQAKEMNSIPELVTSHICIYACYYTMNFMGKYLLASRYIYRTHTRILSPWRIYVIVIVSRYIRNVSYINFNVENASYYHRYI